MSGAITAPLLVPVSIGYIDNESGDFRVLATINNSDGDMTPEQMSRACVALVAHLATSTGKPIAAYMRLDAAESIDLEDDENPLFVTAPAAGGAA